MITRIVRVNPENLEICEIYAVAKSIKEGGLVAFPTETVYGLGADALNPSAVKKVFKVKGRPKDDPLIVHIADMNEIYKLSREIPAEAEVLMKTFWPGPLTLVLKKSNIVPDITTAGLDTVAIRMPKNEIALTLIKLAETPIAAPSANLFGKPSPTSADHVILDLFGRIDFIIDAGETHIGVESTVVDVTTIPPMILRPGGVSLEDLEAVIGRIKLHPAIRAKGKKVVAKSPGMKYKHYAPEAKVILVEGSPEKIERKIISIIKKFKRGGMTVGVITRQKIFYPDADIVKYFNDCHAIAKNLFKTFREFDALGLNIIVAEGVEESGLGLAIMNRLRKASYKIVRA